MFRTGGGLTGGTSSDTRVVEVPSARGEAGVKEWVSRAPGGNGMSERGEPDWRSEGRQFISLAEITLALEPSHCSRKAFRPIASLQ